MYLESLQGSSGTQAQTGRRPCCASGHAHVTPIRTSKSKPKLPVTCSTQQAMLLGRHWGCAICLLLALSTVSSLSSPILSDDEQAALSILLGNETFPANWYTCKDGCTSDLNELTFGSWIDKNQCCTVIDTYFDRPTPPPPPAIPKAYKDLTPKCCFQVVLGTNSNFTSNAFVIALNFRKGTLRQWYMKKNVTFQVPDVFNRFPYLEYIDISTSTVVEGDTTHMIHEYSPKWRLPESLGFCDNLKVIHFDYNTDLIGEVPETYSRLKQLVRFNIDESSVSTCPYDIVRSSNATLKLFLMNSKDVRSQVRFPTISFGSMTCCPIPHDILR